MPVAAAARATRVRCAVALSGGGQGEDGGRDDALGQIIDALEAAPPGRGGDVTGPEEPFELALAVPPFPPAAAALTLIEIGDRKRAFGANAIEHGLNLAALLPGIDAQARPATLAPIGLGHAPAQQGMEFDRQQRSLVRPIFEHAAFGSPAPGRLVHRGAVIGAQPGKGREIMRTRQDVHAVDLVEREAIECAPQVAVADDRRPRRAETLRRKRDAAGACERQCLGQRRSMRCAAQA